MKTKHKIFTRIILSAVPVLSLSLMMGFAQNEMASKAPYANLDFAAKFDNPEAYVKVVDFNDGYRQVKIKPAREGYKILQEEDGVYLQFIEKKYEDPVAGPMDLRIRNIDNKNYIMCTAQCNVKDGIFVLERSADQENFIPVAFKERIGTTANIKLLYSWIDTSATEQSKYFYRVLSLGDDGMYFYSEIISVENPRIRPM